MKFLAHENEPRLLEMVRKCVENITIGGGWGGGEEQACFWGVPGLCGQGESARVPIFLVFLLRVYTRLPIELT